MRNNPLAINPRPVNSLRGAPGEGKDAAPALGPASMHTPARDVATTKPFSSLLPLRRQGYKQDQIHTQLAECLSIKDETHRIARYTRMCCPDHQGHHLYYSSVYIASTLLLVFCMPSLFGQCVEHR